MALPLRPGLTPSEVGFLAEMELVTVIPRQRLEGLQLIGVSTPRLNPPFPAHVPLWLALLLKKQRRANIAPPPWMSVEALSTILDIETDVRLGGALSPHPGLPLPAQNLSADGEPSPPFLPDASTSRAPPDALPYHWLEVSSLLLAHAADDVEDADGVRRLLRDVREVRTSKLRKGFRVLEAGAGVRLNGVGALEVAEVRGFVGGVVDGLRRIGRSREESRREERDGGGFAGEADDDMEL